MRFDAISERVKSGEEIHSNRKLADWIQRVLKKEHAAAIGQYLLTNEERFFNAVVVGVYGGQPRWAELRLRASQRMKESTEFEDDIAQALGFLELNGSERLFAVDGQHRIAGIRAALTRNPELADEEICAIFVAHSNNPEGMRRTRRLFTTLNKTARRTTAADIVALDEDDGFAVLTRRMVDEFELFGDRDVVLMKGSPHIAQTDLRAITTVVGLYDLARDLSPHLFAQSGLTPAKIRRARPTDAVLDAAYTRFAEYWTALCKSVNEYGLVFSGRAMACDFRRNENSHVLFRHVGQRALAGAVSLMVLRGHAASDSITALVAAMPMQIADRRWHNVLWDPASKSVIARNRLLAETFMLRAVGQAPRRPRLATKLDEIAST